MRLSFWQDEEEKEEPVNVSIREAKQLLKERGGRAWTEHYERDGTLFEVTNIKVGSNNSNHKYNHHL